MKNVSDTLLEAVTESSTTPIGSYEDLKVGDQVMFKPDDKEYAGLVGSIGAKHDGNKTVDVMIGGHALHTEIPLERLLKVEMGSVGAPQAASA